MQATVDVRPMGVWCPPHLHPSDTEVPLQDFWFPDSHSGRASVSPGKKPKLSKLISTLIIYPVVKVHSYYFIALFCLVKGLTSRYITFALRECLRVKLAPRQDVKK